MRLACREMPCNFRISADKQNAPPSPHERDKPSAVAHHDDNLLCLKFSSSAKGDMQTILATIADEYCSLDAKSSFYLYLK